MNRKEFIDQLKSSLSRLPQAEINEIIRDQEEYIQDAIQAGRSEENVIASLGDPKTIAASLNATTQIEKAVGATSLKQQAGHTFQAVFAMLALAPFNLIFVLGPFLGFAGLVFGGWVASSSIALSVVAVLIAFLFKFAFASAGIFSFLSMLLFLLGALGAATLALIAMYHISHFFLTSTIRYLRWNLKLAGITKN